MIFRFPALLFHVAQPLAEQLLDVLFAVKGTHQLDVEFVKKLGVRFENHLSKREFHHRFTFDLVGFVDFQISYQTAGYEYAFRGSNGRWKNV